MNWTCLTVALLACIVHVQCRVLSRREDAVSGSSPAPSPSLSPSPTHCSLICPMIWFPVCGSDGKTYGNTCNMHAHACITGKVITVAKQGTCEDGPGGPL